MKRILHSPWLVALAVLVLALLPVMAALSSHREQARRAEALLFERSADVVAGHLRLLTSRQMGWQNSLRMRISNRSEAPETFLDGMFAPNSSVTLLEHSRVIGYAARENGQMILRWQRVKGGAAIGTLGDDLLALPATSALLRGAMEKPMQTASVQDGDDLMTAMAVSESSPRNAHGWVVAKWDLVKMCADSQLRLVTTDHVLTARPLSGELLPGERAMEIGESDVRWRVAVGKGVGFNALFPHVSERAIILTGFGCALLLAALAGFAMRGAGLRAALASERELVLMKDHLLHSVSHEFRTPLSVVLSSVDLLEAYAERLTPERRTEAFTQIRDSTSRMNDMIEQVLLLSRIEARRLPVEPRVTDISVLAIVLAREMETATLARCPIHVTAPEGLEATVDPTLLRAVLNNLLSNAVKFSPAGQPVEFTVQSDRVLRFVIADHGPGITAEDLSLVSEPYFRARSAGEVPGNGLGLTIAEKCARLLGGTLTITSDATGTTATLTI